MTRDERIKFLIDDFLKMFPEASRGEVISLGLRLSFLTDDDLDLLITQCEPPKEIEQNGQI